MRTSLETCSGLLAAVEPRTTCPKSRLYVQVLCFPYSISKLAIYRDPRILHYACALFNADRVT
jgi:hypothetical protein